MKRKIKWLLLFALLLVFASPPRNRASSVDGEKKSAIKVQIIEPEIYLSEVIPPTFNRYPVQQTDIERQADRDLVIEVVDNRSGKNGWKLDYSLSAFKNEQEYAAKLSMKNGRLTAEGPTDYQVNDIEDIGNGETQELVKVNQGTKQTYRLVIPKENILLHVPANSPSGTYKAIQTVNLVNVVADVD
ncbi:WxL domain-containing protein [Candidatus Enterococcus mangumiae]|uniref:WxL domain-containing protein n=1 Tax=Candidatus Enterococcus mangumiae TaxID=2230878 RepID=A0ABZ2T0G0_9ENTE|nr:WxL domain-containing protein [Enterococcus sp. DIV1094]MBO0491213.1 WxL domain-containing protein [Enterococcus sp. DIV1094]